MTIKPTAEYARWEKRFSVDDYIFGEAPNAFLAGQQSRLPKSGRALAVSDGEGRNGVWLAGQGLDVVSMDFSPKAQEKAHALAARRGVKLTTELADIFASRTRDEWCEVMDGTDVCFAPVLSMAEAPLHPHNVARNIFVERHGVTQPAPAPRFSRKERQKARSGPGGAAMTRVSVAMADPRIDQAIEQVDDEVHQNDNAGDEHDAALEGRIIAPPNGFNQPFADARPGKNRFGENRAGKQRAHLQAYDGDNRDQRVAQRMKANDAEG